MAAKGGERVTYDNDFVFWLGNLKSARECENPAAF